MKLDYFEERNVIVYYFTLPVTALFPMITKNTVFSVITGLSVTIPHSLGCYRTFGNYREYRHYR